MQMFFYITCANTKEAKKISSVLVKKKLIACANIFNNIQSVFSWKNKVNFSKEVIIMGKTTKKRQTKICLLYTSPSPRDRQKSRMPSSA